MTRITLDLTDKEIQMITYLINNHAAEERNPSAAKRAAYAKSGIVFTEELLIENEREILKTSDKIMEAYKNGVSLGRDE